VISLCEESECHRSEGTNRVAFQYSHVEVRYETTLPDMSVATEMRCKGVGGREAGHVPTWKEECAKFED